MDAASDAALLRRYAQRGDEEAFNEIVRRHVGLVYRAALRQTDGDSHAARDIAQVVFTLVARKAAALSNHQALAGWLHTTTRFAARRHQRSERRRAKREQEAEIMHEHSGPETASANWDRLRPLIDDVLAELNAADREAVLLRFFSGLSLTELGTKLNISENAARMRVERALLKLQALLARRGIASTAAVLELGLGHSVNAAVPAGLATSVSGAALASAAATGGGLATALTFMTTKTAALGAAALLVVGTVLFEFHQVRAARDTIAALRNERDGLNARVRALEESASSKSQIPELDRAGSAPVTLREGAERTEMPKTPKRSQARAPSVDARYQALYRQLHFSAEERERFNALALDYLTRHDELMEVAAEQAPITASLDRSIAERARADFIATVRTSFGDAAGQALQRYETTFPFRGPLDELAKNLFYTDTPLTAAQAELLLERIGADPDLSPARTDLMVQRDFHVLMLTHAAGVLSAPQVEALQQMLAREPSRSGSAPKKTRAGVVAPAIPARSTSQN